MNTKNDDRWLRWLDVLFRVVTSIVLLIAILIILREKDTEAREPVSHLQPVNLAAMLKPTDCTYAALLQAISRGGDIYMNCATPLLLDDTLVITTQVRLRATYDTPLILSGRGILQTVVRVDAGGSLYVENVQIIDSRRFGIYVERGGAFTAFTCRFAGHGSDTGDGAAVWNKNGSVFMDSCVFENNSSVDAAAAVVNWNDGAMEIHESTFRNNTTQRGNGAAIYNFGALLVWNSTFDDNGNMPIVSSSGNMTLEDSTIKQASGGTAVYNAQNSVLTLRYGSVESTTSSAVYNQGTLSIDGTTFGSTPGLPCYNTGALNDPNHACKL